MLILHRIGRESGFAAQRPIRISRHDGTGVPNISIVYRHACEELRYSIEYIK
jgi:hypothetical protein